MKKKMLITMLVLLLFAGMLFAQKIEVIKEKVGGSRPTKRVEFIDKNNKSAAKRIRAYTLALETLGIAFRTKSVRLEGES